MRVGEVSRQDIINAANKFGKRKEDAQPLLHKLGFTNGVDSVHVTQKIKANVIFQTGKLTSQQIAEQLCEKSFGSTPTPDNTFLLS